MWGGGQGALLRWRGANVPAQPRLRVHDEEELREHLTPGREGHPAEVWLEDSESGSLLSNGREAFLLHLPDVEGEHPGWTTRAARIEGPKETVSGFVLSNGQVNAFPSSWLVPLAEGVDAFAHFYRHGERAPWLTWHDDSKERPTPPAPPGQTSASRGPVG